MNYLEKPLLKFFNLVEYYQGYLNHLHHDLAKFEEIITDQIDSNIKFLKGTRIVITDISGVQDRGCDINYNLQTEGYIVNHSNYKDKNEEIYILVSLNLVVQCYEALETFLKEILIEYFSRNEQIAAETIGRANFVQNRSKVDWKSTVRKLDQGENNQGLLKLLRLLSSNFAHVEESNVRSIDLAKWFQMLSIVRHAIVHSNSYIKNEQRNKLKAQMTNYLEYYFRIEEAERGSLKIEIDQIKQRRLFKFICEYCFQIFKSLSQTAELDWKVLPNMKNEA